MKLGNYSHTSTMENSEFDSFIRPTTLMKFPFVHIELYVLPIILILRVQKSLSFRDLIDSPTFVDKTPLLPIFFDDIASSIRQFIVCPPGFGKTTILDMIDLFSSMNFNYDNTIKIPNTTDSFDIFNRRTKLGVCEKFINGNLGRYIVLRLDANINPEYSKYTSGLAYDFLYDMLNKALERYSEILNEDRLTRSEKMFLQELYERRFDTKEITCLLGYLIKMLHDYFQTPVILLIDNYDLPMKRSIFQADSNPNVDILYDIFNEMIFYASKYPRNYLCRFVIMSTTSIPFNWYTNETRSFHLHEFAVKNAYENYLGFTEPEMKELLGKWKLTPAEKREIREFYMSAYIHPEYDIYNPRSITNYLKHRNAIKTNRTLHLEIYKNPLDDFKFIFGSFQGTEFEQKLYLLSSNQSIRLPGIWIGDKLTLSVLKNTTDYKDFVNRGFIWIYLLESSYVTYSMDGLGFQAVDRIGSAMMEFIDENVLLNNQLMLNSINRFQSYLSKAFQNVVSTPELHPRESIFTAVIYISSHVSSDIESSMIISEVEISSNLTVTSARYNIYYQNTSSASIR